MYVHHCLATSLYIRDKRHVDKLKPRLDWTEHTGKLHITDPDLVLGQIDLLPNVTYFTCFLIIP